MDEIKNIKLEYNRELQSFLVTCLSLKTLICFPGLYKYGIV